MGRYENGYWIESTPEEKEEASRKLQELFLRNGAQQIGLGLPMPGQPAPLPNGTYTQPVQQPLKVYTTYDQHQDIQRIEKKIDALIKVVSKLVEAQHEAR